jgi:hypothetical protein
LDTTLVSRDSCLPHFLAQSVSRCFRLLREILLTDIFRHQHESILQSNFGDWHRSEYVGASNIVAMFAGESDPPAPCHFPFDRGLIADKYRVKRVMPENPNADPYTTPATLPVLFCICDRWLYRSTSHSIAPPLATSWARH